MNKDGKMSKKKKTPIEYIYEYPKSKDGKYKCLFCDKEKVEWNGMKWECGNCGATYGQVVKLK